MKKPTVADLVAALLKLPQDAEVECLKEESYGYVTTTVYAPIDLEYGIQVFDYTKPGDEVKYPTMFGRKFVQFEAI